MGRVAALYSLLALKVGQSGAAYEVLTDPRMVSKPTIVTTNLKIRILTETGHLADVLQVIREEVLPFGDSSDYDQVFISQHFSDFFAYFCYVVLSVSVSFSISVSVFLSLFFVLFYLYLSLSRSLSLNLQ